MIKRTAYIIAQKEGLTRLFRDFFQNEKTSGIILICCTLCSLLLANSGFSEAYVSFWHSNFNGHSYTHWINDGLMSIFFLMIGLELEREIYIGELSNFKNALFPAFSALGGALIPAGIYLIFNWGSLTSRGAGIPMATDIAFAIGVLAILGKRVPASLKIFLTALAVIDDLLAILVIAVFYTDNLSFVYLGLSLAVFAILLLMNRFRVNILILYLIGGVSMWYFMLHSGIHASIAGVLLAFAIPFGNGNKKTISYQLQLFLHKPVAFFIVPLFALANTCIPIGANWSEGLYSSESLGIILGLVIGKPIGIILFSLGSVKSRICNLPQGLQWKHILGAGMLGGIGFTMSLFITMLAFKDETLINTAKIAIMAASLIAGVLGYVLLRRMLMKEEPNIST